MNRALYLEETWYMCNDLTVHLSGDELNDLEITGIVTIEGGQKFKFTFVGVISLINIVLIILPKTFKNDLTLTGKSGKIDLTKNWKLVEKFIRSTILTLKRYSRSGIQKFDGIDYFNSEPDQPECSELAIAEILINDFQMYGVLTVQEERIAENGNGEIEWELTITSTDPIISKGKPIYIITKNIDYLDDLENLTVAIHRWSLGYSFKKYSMLLGFEDDNIDLDYVEDLEEIGTKQQLINHIQNELNETFSDRRIRILKSILFLIKGFAPIESKSLSLYGTKKFDKVWEMICKAVLNDNYPKLKNKYNLFPEPKWIIFGKKYNSSSELIPDIITENKTIETFFLFDAKYYKLSYNGSLKGEPGYKDILKQFLYQQHIEKKIIEKENYNTVINSFLFPISNSEYVDALKDKGIILYNDLMLYIGYIEYELYENKKINTIMCPLLKWMDYYLESKTFDKSVTLQISEWDKQNPQ